MRAHVCCTRVQDDPVLQHICERVHKVSTSEGISMLYESLIAFGVGGHIGLLKLSCSLLSHMCLLEGLCEAGHRHVLPLTLGFVVLLHAVG